MTTSPAVETPPNNPVVVEHLVHLKKPHAKQALFINSTCKRKIIRAGRRGGKTTGMAILAVLSFLKGLRVLYAVPTSDQIKKFWFEVTNALAAGIESGALYKNETEHIIEKKGTTQRIRAKTAWNADTLRGDYADVLILDEWQLMNEGAWEDVGAPMLIDNNGDAVFVYTPPTLETAGVTKANDPRHAAKMYEKHLNDPSGRWGCFHFTSYDNPKLSAAGLIEVTRDMTQASIKREVMAEDTKEVPGALWKQELIDATRISPSDLPADLELVMVGVDPTGSSTNEAGIVATARGSAPKCAAQKGWATDKKHGYVLRDASCLAPTSKTWATASVGLYFDVKADELLGERNYGGDMVEGTIRQVEGGQNVSYRDANATRGKIVRAAPVAAAYESFLFHHVGVFPELEDEMTSYVPGNDSPNRMDAMVWGALRIVEGMDVLGLLMFERNGGMAAELKKLEARQAPVVITAAKELGGNQSAAARCSACNCVAGQLVPGGQLRCGECGSQWWPAGAPNLDRPNRMNLESFTR